MAYHHDKPALPIIHPHRCTGCGLCAELCPTHAVEVRNGRATIARPADCTFCEVCESSCPEEAITRPFTIVFAPTPPLASTVPEMVRTEYLEDSPMTTTPITADENETLNELVARAPEVLPVLQRFGLDTCCGGALTLAVAAQHHNLEVAEILTALRAALSGAGKGAMGEGQMGA